MSEPAKRAAVYLRVSSGDQREENQGPDVARLVQARGYEVVATYQEKRSAAKHRPEFARVMADAKSGNFGVLVIWAVDRFGRSMHGNIRDVLDLDAAGVQIVSCLEPWLDTRSPVRDLLLAIFSWVAEQERRRIVERTKAGMDRARRLGTESGKPIGRPRRVDRLDVERALAMRAEGRSLREIAIALKLKRSTLARALAAASSRKGDRAEPSTGPGEPTPEPPAS